LREELGRGVGGLGLREEEKGLGLREEEEGLGFRECRVRGG
jgi:hypothetical protein